MLTAAWEGDVTRENLLSALEVIGATNMSQEANLSVGRDSKRLQLTADASRRTDDQRHPPVDGANGLDALMMCGMESAEEVAAPCMMFFQCVLLLVLCILRLNCHDAKLLIQTETNFPSCQVLYN